MESRLSQIAKARLASGLTIEDARKAIGMSYPTYKQREDNPKLFSLEELYTLSHELNSDGKRIFDEWLAYFFEL